MYTKDCFVFLIKRNKCWWWSWFFVFVHKYKKTIASFQSNGIWAGYDDKVFVSTFYVHLNSSVEGNHRALWRSQRTGPAIWLVMFLMVVGMILMILNCKRRIQQKLNERIWTAHLMLIVSNIFQCTWYVRPNDSMWLCMLFLALFAMKKSKNNI